MSNPQREYYSNSQIRFESFMLNGEVHRTDGPASSWWHENGQKEYESYLVDGIYHREDGPAHIEWYENGQKEYESYLVHGKWHREDGPARTWWNEDGTLIDQQFWLDDEEVTAYDVLDEKAAFVWVMANE